MKPMKRCSHSRCRELIPYDEKYCSKHKNDHYKQYNKERYRYDKEYIKFYSSKEWQNLRQTKLNQQPLCEQCLKQGHVTPATIVHHIIETKKDWSKRLDFDNLESVCAACHNKLHA
ncbi:HNH endonuclease signature motif containing protein [Bacillus licheniformis]|uniref:Putative HNH nuclease YajD n=2 Tax=Bacillus licheniformis TaxID=1402 RepID=A0AB37GE74_BACLI|nr:MULTISPECIES: HNH endonuclease signature motif containing protein [Bacillus]AYC54141.1 HNH endonuclease [Bacillus licheniformis]MDD0822670.1 HNH endonuclease signature motif containing protein [Bacillus cereus]QPR70544.1 HNH endonuclease [Bacillus licheniformis]